MSMNQARFGLMGIFLVSLVLQLVAIFLTRNRMWPEELLSLVLKLLGIYSVQLGVVLGGIFSQPRGPLAEPPSGLTWTAFALVTMWNLLLAWRSISFGIAAQDSVSDLIKYLDSIASSSSFLVAGVLTFFFAKGTDVPNSTQRN
jgi:hypothetical protein